MVIGYTPHRRRPGSSGLAMTSVEMRIVDEAGTILSEPGKTGRLEVRMPSVCAGYRAGDDKSSEPPHLAITNVASMKHFFFIQRTSVAKLVSNIRQQPPQNLIAAPSLKAPMYRFVVGIALRAAYPIAHLC
jgi:hypothetical protein